ncbi:creatininase family protein [bacterium]|nr:creatininase family protein [bacterium]
MQTSLEFLRPEQIIAARDASGCAFVPVSPMFEWHGPHLPVGTDGIVSEALCAIVAGRIGGVYLRTLPCGLDATRTPDELKQWGLPPGADVFGMRFPGLPVSCEYTDAAAMRAAVEARIAALRLTGFRHVFLVNHHGGKGQFALLDEIAAGATSEACRVHAVRTYQFNTLGAKWIGTGGHAGYSETHWVMAFRPELVRLEALPEGALDVAGTGILHSEPVVPERFNPRNCSAAVATELREAVVRAFEQHVRQMIGA